MHTSIFVSPVCRSCAYAAYREDPKPDDEVLSMVCSVVSCISKDGEDESIGKIVDAGLGSALVSLLRYKNPRVQAAAVRESILQARSKCDPTTHAACELKLTT